MDISKLTSAATEVLAGRESTGKAVTLLTVETVRDGSGWIAYDGIALVTFHDGETALIDIRETGLSAALERHADDEAELGLLPVAIPIRPRRVPLNSTVLCDEHSGTHLETTACRWPHDVAPAGPQHQVGHPYLLTD
jgi:hypothetical protein